MTAVEDGVEPTTRYYIEIQRHTLFGVMISKISFHFVRLLLSYNRLFDQRCCQERSGVSLEIERGPLDTTNPMPNLHRGFYRFKCIKTTAFLRLNILYPIMAQSPIKRGIFSQ